MGTENNELLPCPCCGGPAIASMEDQPEAWWIGCEKNGCVATDTHFDLDEAAVAWNRRAPVSQPVGAVVADERVALIYLCDWLDKLPRRQIKDGQTHSYIAADNVEALVEQARAALASQPAKPADVGGVVGDFYVVHGDDAAVDLFAAAMKKKMAESRAKGRDGWYDPEQCPAERLQRMLVDHLAKGDPVDVGNFAMMLFNRDLPTAALAAQTALPEFSRDPDGDLALDWVIGGNALSVSFSAASVVSWAVTLADGSTAKGSEQVEHSADPIGEFQAEARQAKLAALAAQTAAPTRVPISRSGCNYVAEEGSICNKCGHIHTAAPAPDAPVDLSDEQIMQIWAKADQPSKENNWTTGPIMFARALLAAGGK